MNNIIIKTVKAHNEQLINNDIQKELKDVNTYVQMQDISDDFEGVMFMLIRGYYDNFTKKMTTVFVLINKTGDPISEIHGVISLKSKNESVKFAKATIDFDSAFLGKVENDEGVLIHLNIPTKGMNEDKIFNASEIVPEFRDVRVTYLDK